MHCTHLRAALIMLRALRKVPEVQAHAYQLV